MDTLVKRLLARLLWATLLVALAILTAVVAQHAAAQADEPLQPLPPLPQLDERKVALGCVTCPASSNLQFP